MDPFSGYQQVPFSPRFDENATLPSGRHDFYKRMHLPEGLGSQTKITKINLAIVTDCGGTDEGRYRIAVKRCFHPLNVSTTFFATRSLNTLHAGFVTAAHALSAIDHFGPLPEGEVWGILDNAAPRAEKGLRGVDRKVSGEEIYVLTLDNGVVVVGPNAGYNFHFIKSRVRSSQLVEDVSGQKTPFRSMEVMVPALAEALANIRFSRLQFTNKELRTPEVAGGTFVGDVDSHGNIYLAEVGDKLRLPSVGNKVRVTIDGHTHAARYVESIFAGETGELCLTFGSLTLGGTPVPYLVRVGGSAHKMFGCADVGKKITTQRLTAPF